MPISSVLPANEPARLDALRRYEILDTPPDGAFDRIAALAARLFDVPIATVTLVDHDRIWFKARHGVEVTETGRDPGLCASVICQDDPYVVTDALNDPRTLENPLVRGALKLRFYAAAPIRTPDGYNLGTINVIGREPRSVTAEEMATLAELAAIVADELELRLEARRTVELERAQREEAERLTAILQERLLPRETPGVPGLDLATLYLPVSPVLDAGGDFFDVIDLSGGVWAIVIGDMCGKGPEVAAVTGEIRHMLRALAHVERRPSEVLGRLNEVLAGEEFIERFCTACYARIDTTADPVEMVVCSAGHPLPLVRRADGRVEHVGAPGQLLGPFNAIELTDHTTRLAVDDLLLLYTDGAVEQRGMPLGIGERALVRALESADHAGADKALDHVRRAVLEQHDTLGDDIALVLARIAGRR